MPRIQASATPFPVIPMIPARVTLYSLNVSILAAICASIPAFERLVTISPRNRLKSLKTPSHFHRLPYPDTFFHSR